MATPKESSDRFAARGTRFLSIDDVTQLSGTAVVVDVLRAFTTTAVAFTRGAQRIILLEGVEGAFALRARHPDWLLMGELDGLPIRGFDLSNSPLELLAADVAGRTIIHRTTSGTRAVALAAQRSQNIFCASLVCARATAAALTPGLRVSYVISGLCHERRWIDDGDDDRAVAEFIDDLRFGVAHEQSCLERVRSSRAAESLRSAGIAEEDITISTLTDHYPMIMTVSREENMLVLRPPA